MAELDEQLQHPQVVAVDVFDGFDKPPRQKLLIFPVSGMVEGNSRVNRVDYVLGHLLILGGFVGAYGLVEEQRSQFAVALQLPLILGKHGIEIGLELIIDAIDGQLFRRLIGLP